MYFDGTIDQSQTGGDGNEFKQLTLQVTNETVSVASFWHILGGTL